LVQDRQSLSQDIEATRGRIDDAIEALSYKADVKSRTRESIIYRKDKVMGRVSQAKDRAVESLVGTKDSARESVSGAKESVGSTVSTATPSTEDIKYGATRTAGLAQENPWGFALGAVAVGFLAGTLMRSTRLEEEKVGPVADQIKEKVIETGQEAIERGKQVVESLPQAAEEAKQSVSERVAETAKEQAQELAAHTKERAESISTQ
jgi:ElaB/YqjD/DUF883 family membrane-anchored ribosome-binding protein